MMAPPIPPVLPSSQSGPDSDREEQGSPGPWRSEERVRGSRAGGMELSHVDQQRVFRGKSSLVGDTSKTEQLECHRPVPPAYHPLLQTQEAREGQAFVPPLLPSQQSLRQSWRRPAAQGHTKDTR